MRWVHCVLGHASSSLLQWATVSAWHFRFEDGAAKQTVGKSTMSVENDRLVTVATFVEPNRAHIAKGRLEAEGIQAALDGEHHVGMDWMISNAVGGVKLLVHHRDRETAMRVLKDAPSELQLDLDAEDDTGRTLATCPKCGSSATYAERLNRKLIFVSILLLGVPLPFLTRKSFCQRCEHRWRSSP